MRGGIPVRPNELERTKATALSADSAEPGDQRLKDVPAAAPLPAADWGWFLEELRDRRVAAIAALDELAVRPEASSATMRSTAGISRSRRDTDSRTTSPRSSTVCRLTPTTPDTTGSTTRGTLRSTISSVGPMRVAARQSSASIRNSAARVATMTPSTSASVVSRFSKRNDFSAGSCSPRPSRGAPNGWQREGARRDAFATAQAPGGLPRPRRRPAPHDRRAIPTRAREATPPLLPPTPCPARCVSLSGHGRWRAARRP